jgi:hypothetical protein
MGCVLCMSEPAYLGERVSAAYDAGLVLVRRGHYFKVSLMREPSLAGTAEWAALTEAWASSEDCMSGRGR